MRERSFPKGSSRFGNPLAEITLQADFALGIERQCLPRADRRQPYLVCRLLLEKKKDLARASIALASSALLRRRSRAYASSMLGSSSLRAPGFFLRICSAS